ncbi:DUF5130 family protein [Cumulibacter soli]|uniref:DUF5130 family protein n=1 Tax=Cumulibacter soli TaxID=2546344 RepID=UPI001068A425|nr:DUF5130 family protein [Cumulibacter soli]
MASTLTTSTPTLAFGPEGNTGPFNFTEMDRLSEALTRSSHETGINFSVLIGDLGPDRRGAVAAKHRTFGHEARDTCLVAVSPNEHAIEIGVGEHAARRIDDRDCELAVAAMSSSFAGGDLIGGLVNALRMLADAAGNTAE